MFRSIRLRALFFSILFFTSIVIVIRIVQFQYTKETVNTTVGQQMRSRLYFLMAFAKHHLGDDQKSPPDRTKIQRMETGLSPEIFRATILDYPIEFFWGVQGRDGAILGGQNFPAEIRPGTFTATSEPNWWEGQIETEKCRVITVGLPNGMILFVGGMTSNTTNPLTKFIYLNFVFGFLTILFVTFVIWVILGQIFKPLSNISSTAEKIGKGKLSSRIPIGEIDKELRQMGLSLNAMLDRLENTIEGHARFNSEVSHEILSPLNRILSITNEALDSSKTIDELRSILLECQNAVKKTTTLASDLLELARSEAASAHTHTWIDLEPVMEESVGQMEAMALEKGVTIAVTGSTVGVMANPLQIHQVLINLLTNALKHSPANGTVQLTLKKNGAWAEISVKDSGPGVPSQEADKLFQRFFRTKTPESGNLTGHGLGLAICKNIIDQHHGTIRYERTADGFTLFQVNLPTMN